MNFNNHCRTVRSHTPVFDVKKWQIIYLEAIYTKSTRGIQSDDNIDIIVITSLQFINTNLLFHLFISSFTPEGSKMDICKSRRANEIAVQFHISFIDYSS